MPSPPPTRLSQGQFAASQPPAKRIRGTYLCTIYIIVQTVSYPNNVLVNMIEHALFAMETAFFVASFAFASSSFCSFFAFFLGDSSDSSRFFFLPFCFSSASFSFSFSFSFSLSTFFLSLDFDLLASSSPEPDPAEVDFRFLVLPFAFSFLPFLSFLSFFFFFLSLLSIDQIYRLMVFEPDGRCGEKISCFEDNQST